MLKGPSLCCNWSIHTALSAIDRSRSRPTTSRVRPRSHAVRASSCRFARPNRLFLPHRNSTSLEILPALHRCVQVSEARGLASRRARRQSQQRRLCLGHFNSFIFLLFFIKKDISLYYYMFFL